jgi:hypothetical protein
LKDPLEVGLGRHHDNCGLFSCYNTGIDLLISHVQALIAWNVSNASTFELFVDVLQRNPVRPRLNVAIRHHFDDTLQFGAAPFAKAGDILGQDGVIDD